MIGLLCLGAAWAGGLHTGIPVRALSDLGEPTFETPQTGWTVPAPGGYVRVFVGRDEDAARAWVASTAMAFTRPLAAFDGPGDESWGDGVGVVLFRDGNVGVLTRADEAGALSQRLHAAIVDDGPPWPAAPSLSRQSGGTWIIDAPDAVHLSVQGGRRAGPRARDFREPPTSIVAWDGYGRATTAP